MSSAPIAIPTMTSAVAASAASSPTSGLYVPVHKRTGSSASSRSSSSTRSERTTSPSPPAPATHPLIYSRDALLGLMHSPLARLPLDTREALRAEFPELVTNRRQRKALEYHTHIHIQAQAQALLQKQGLVQSKSQPFVRVQPRRNRPAGRAPERRRNATKVVDEASWRGRRVVAVPIAV